MFQSCVLPLFLLSLFQQSTHGSPIQPRSSNAPVITTNFMDPSVIEVDGGYYAMAGANGNPAGINVQVASSPDFAIWTVESGYDALPVLGPWAANPGHVWSPDINQLVCIFKQDFVASSLLTMPFACLGRRLLHPLLLRRQRRLPRPTLHRRRRFQHHPRPILPLLRPTLLPPLRRRRD
jgi:hypothetical protein